MTDIVSSSDWPKIRDWRKKKRAALIDQRMQISKEQHLAWSRAMTGMMVAGFAPLAGMVIGFCWPFKNEFDARFVIRRFREQGAVAALPLVVEKAGPLQFRKWWPGAPMMRGVYDIPVPDGTELLVPDALIAPMNGFDEGGYRLGYGGGYFDRTLAGTQPRPLSIGVSFELARLPTIYPQPHDVAMDFVVTEAGIHAVAGTLAAIDAPQCCERLQKLATERGLPRPRRERADAYTSPACYAAEFEKQVNNDKD